MTRPARSSALRATRKKKQYNLALGFNQLDNDFELEVKIKIVVDKVTRVKKFEVMTRMRNGESEIEIEVTGGGSRKIGGLIGHDERNEENSQRRREMERTKRY